MNSLNDAIQRSTTDIPVVATANSNTRSHVLGPVPRRNALTGDVENIKTRLVGFEAAFDTMEARLNLLTAQQEAPMPTSGKYIGNNPEMSDHIRFAYMSLNLKWNFLVPYQDESNRAVRDELVLHVMDILTHYNAPLYTIKKRVYNHYRNNRVADLKNVDLAKTVQLAVCSRAHSYKMTAFSPWASEY